MKVTTIKPTTELLELVRSEIMKKYGMSDDSKYGPELRMDFDWLGYGAWPAIVWEGGPHDWATDCSFELLDALPKGAWLEPVTSWSLNVYVDALV